MMHGSGMEIGWFIGVLFLVLIIWFIIKIINHNFNPEKSKSALDILKDRFENGEIDSEEFENLKKDLL